MITDFLKHLFPRVVPERNLRFNYTFCLGGLAFSAFLIMLVSGMLLLVYYQPTPERAFNSILFLESSVWGGKYLRSLHRLTSHTLLVLILLHTLRVILTGPMTIICIFTIAHNSFISSSQHSYSLQLSVTNQKEDVP